MSKTCYNCGAQLPEGAATCPYCGKAVPPSTATPPTVPPSAGPSAVGTPPPLVPPTLPRQDRSAGAGKMLVPLVAVFAVLLIVVIAGGGYLLYDHMNSNSSASQPAAAVQSPPATDTERAKQFIKDWTYALSSDNIYGATPTAAIYKLYAPQVRYYGNNYSRSQVYNHISDYIHKRKSYHITVDNLLHTTLSDGNIRLDFDKTIERDGESSYYPAVYLVVNSDWQIVTESDPVTDGRR